MVDIYGYYQAPNPIGFITVGLRSNDAVFSCQQGKNCHTPLTGPVKQWLDDYFAGKSLTYEGIVELPGTRFQRLIWINLFSIPYGATISYAGMAYIIGSPNSYRPVGTACGANPCPLFVPCHRVVGSTGLGGFAWGLECKQFLLNLEKFGLQTHPCNMPTRTSS